MNTRCSHNVFFDHGGTKIVRSKMECKLGHFWPHGHPRGLDIVKIVQHDPGERQKTQISNGRFPTSRWIAVLVGWKGQGMKAVKPPVRSCKSRRAKRCSTRWRWFLFMSEHHGRRSAKSLAMGLLHDLQPFRRRTLIGRDGAFSPNRPGSRHRLPEWNRAPPL